MKYSVLFCITICFYAIFANADENTSTAFDTRECVLFKRGDFGYHTFRIPAIVTAADGSLVAFAEGRKDGASDSGRIDTVARRSQDGGKTWSKPYVVRSDGKNTFGNPQPILDRKSGDLILLSLWGLASDDEHKVITGKAADRRRTYVSRSSDCGATWSEPLEITEQVMGRENTWFAAGPGGGIQIEGGRFDGRIVAAIDTATANPHIYWAGAVYSDDGGKSWRRGELVKYEGANECQVAQLDSDTLILNMRVQGRSKNGARKTLCRVIATSSDGGATWSPAIEESDLPEPICEAAFISFQNAENLVKKRGARTLVFSNPADTHARKNMTVKFSDTKTYSEWLKLAAANPAAAAKTPHWNSSQVICPSGAGYSDMTFTADGDIALFYERGKSSFDELVFRLVKNPVK